MSLIDTLKSTLLGLVARLPLAALEALIELVNGALKSDDPARYLQRKAQAEASELATEAAIETTLAASAAKKPDA